MSSNYEDTKTLANLNFISLNLYKLKNHFVAIMLGYPRSTLIKLLFVVNSKWYWFLFPSVKTLQTHKTHQVAQFHVTWNGNGSSSSLIPIVEVIEEVSKQQRRTANHPIAVLCKLVRIGIANVVLVVEAVS